MRADERSGAVFLVLLFLWGTLVAEPLHIYTHYIRKITESVMLFFGLDPATLWMRIVILIVFAVIGSVMIKLCETAIGPYIGTVLCILTLTGYIINSVMDHEMSIVVCAVFAVSLAILAFLHLTRNNEWLVWASDAFVLSHPVYILANMFFVPIAMTGETVDKILYITNYKDLNLARPFDGIIGIPAAVWGPFLAVLAVLPIAYFALTRRKS